MNASKSKKNWLLEELAKKVRVRRVELNLTQRELAEKANFHVNYIGGIERAERNISYKKLIELAQALKISPKNFMPE
ncbi:MAG: putative transcriptional regulator [Chlamydiia bacterium]|nr:putative transcriptional regulator [Chlamydiia bacterium]